MGLYVDLCHIVDAAEQEAIRWICPKRFGLCSIVFLMLRLLVLVHGDGLLPLRPAIHGQSSQAGQAALLDL
jgi:hypothetical protein